MSGKKAKPTIHKIVGDYSIFDGLHKFNDEFKALRLIMKDKEAERIEWCRANRDAIKKLYPKVGATYKISDVRHAFSSFYFYPDPDLVYYFKATSSDFRPALQLNSSYGNEFPLAIGDLYDHRMSLIKTQLSIKIHHLKCDEEVDVISISGDDPNKVYVMLDENTGLHKIGRSIHPLKREKTLQSEKPTIKLLHVYDAPKEVETKLHRMFKHKRLRGEWFDLEHSDLELINNYFTDNVS